MINKDGGGGQFLDFMRGTQSSWGDLQPHTPLGKTPESKLESELDCIKGTLS